MESALYTGQVRHRRFSPENHEFNYRVFMVWLDLDEIFDVFAQSRFWSSTSPAMIWFRRKDFFDASGKPLKQAVLDWVYQQTGRRLNGPVRLLANLRFAGFLVNPIVCYYCYSDDGETLEYVVSEVTNTPWNQRQHYLLPCNGLGTEMGETAQGTFDKILHVSPFHPMDMEYRWKLDHPSSKLNLHFDNLRQGEKVFDASLMLNREALTTLSMRSALWRFPFMTFKVFLGIYWQALRLFIKKVPFYANPNSNSTSNPKKESGAI